MLFAEDANPSSRPHRLPGSSLMEALYTEHCSPATKPEPCFQILGAMNRIMAEHFGVHPVNGSLHISLLANGLSSGMRKLEER